MCNVAPRTESESPDQARLQQAVQDYQQAYNAWEIEFNPVYRAELYQQLRMTQDSLLMLLLPPLLKVAQGWSQSGAMRDMYDNRASYPAYRDAMEALALSLYLHVVDALPKLKVDPERDLCACLMLIARRGIYDENRRIYSQTPRWRKGNSGPIVESLYKSRPVGDGTDYDTDELADPASHDMEAQLIALCDVQMLSMRVQEFCQHASSDEDRHILMARLQTTPPVRFTLIAEQLGPGWTAATVRKRYERALKRLRIYLEAQGWDATL